VSTDGRSVVDLLSLAGRKAIVTGGSRGIGRGIAKGLAEAGADVAVIYEKTRDKAEAFVEQLRAMGRTGSYAAQADVGSRAAVERITREAVERFGRIDILVNNAGIAHGAAAEDLTEAEWDRMIAINLTSVFTCCQVVGRVMIAQKGGVIVNVGSLSAKIVNYPQKQAHYNAAKAGVHMLSKCLAVEWAGHGIRVNILTPGYIRTDLVEPFLATREAEAREHWLKPSVQNRFGTPEELAGAAVYLASDASSFMTGEEMVIDGGYTLR
jgi:NAD(P)-dependent dehydrogenase (short-subunit alcohol dehydrogenase family)